MSADPKLVEAVKQALDEIEYDKLHTKVHGRILSKLGIPPEGKVAMAKCGMCEAVLESRGYEP